MNQVIEGILQENSERSFLDLKIDDHLDFFRIDHVLDQNIGHFQQLDYLRVPSLNFFAETRHFNFTSFLEEFQFLKHFLA